MLPKKGSRRIVVGDQAYRWALTPGGFERGHHLILIHDDDGGALLTAHVALDNLVTPRFVRALIERGLELGWAEDRPRQLNVDTVVAVRGRRLLEGILAAVRRDDHRTALSRTLEAWRRYRVPALADITERIGTVASLEEGAAFDPLLAAPGPIPTRLVKATLERAEEIGSADPVRRLIERHGDDPRVPIGLYRGLVDLEPNEASSELLELVLSACVASWDHRLVTPLKQEARNALAHHALGSLSRLNVRVKRACTDLERCFPMGPPYLVDADESLEEVRIQLGLSAPEPPEHAAALVARIYDQPGDDDARLVLADLLEQAGDARGELIHLQIAQHRGELDDEGARRIDRLLALHEHRWRGALDDLLIDVVFERGFPVAGTLNLRSLTSSTIEPTEELATIERLSIPYLNVEPEELLDRLTTLLCSHPLRNLRTLDGAFVELIEALAGREDAPQLTKICLRPLAHLDEVAERAEALGHALASGLPTLRELRISSEAWPVVVLERLRAQVGPQVQVVAKKGDRLP